MQISIPTFMHQKMMWSIEHFGGSYILELRKVRNCCQFEITFFFFFFSWLFYACKCNPFYSILNVGPSNTYLLQPHLSGWFLNDSVEKLILKFCCIWFFLILHKISIFHGHQTPCPYLAWKIGKNWYVKYFDICWH